MATHNKSIAKALLDTYGTTYAEELGIDLTKDTPSVLFRWLCAAVMMSARISSDNAMRGAKALAEAGWTTADHMANSTWKERVKVLNEHGYARYDESTARMLGEDAEILLERYDGDLRKLRDKAGREPEEERKLLKEFKGIGDVGADIFMRETQTAWEELYPFADRKALSSAGKLGLPENAEGLAELVSKSDYTALVAALVRCDLAKGHEEIKSAAKA